MRAPGDGAELSELDGRLAVVTYNHGEDAYRKRVARVPILKRSDDNSLLYWMVFALLLLFIASYAYSQWDIRAVQKREIVLANNLKTMAASSSKEDIANLLEAELQGIDREEFWAGFFHHLSLAFLVSLLTILAVEIHT